MRSTGSRTGTLSPVGKKGDPRDQWHQRKWAKATATSKRLGYTAWGRFGMLSLAGGKAVMLVFRRPNSACTVIFLCDPLMSFLQKQLVLIFYTSYYALLWEALTYCNNNSGWSPLIPTSFINVLSKKSNLASILSNEFSFVMFYTRPQCPVYWGGERLYTVTTW